MTAYKALFLDIDGTILRPDDTIEESTKTAIAAVREQGIEVFLATGRPLHEIMDIAEELHINSFIGYNGAYAIYEGQDLFHAPMDGSTVEHFLEVAEKYGHEVIMYTNRQNFFTTLEMPLMKEFIKKFHLRQNALFTPDVINDILGMTLINLKEVHPSLYETNEGIHLSQVNLEGMLHCYDVIRDNVNKGIGVRVILERLSIPRESSIAFGDGMNDKEMLAYAGEGFAMGNGHPELFKYSKHKTTSVNDSGIYNGLKSLGLL